MTHKKQRTSMEVVDCCAYQQECFMITHHKDASKIYSTVAGDTRWGGQAAVYTGSQGAQNCGIGHACWRQYHITTGARTLQIR